MADLNNEKSDLDEKIIRQVEYYFGDFNFPKDKFLQEQIKLDDGWIPLSTMLNFKRLASLTTDQDRIVDALKKSTAKLIEVNEEKKKIRRSVDKPAPLMTESRHKEIQSRTIYCKGFSKENVSLDKLLEYFKQYGSVENVQMRTYLDKASKEYIFKGSVFVVFSTKDLAEEFLKKEGLEYDGTPLIIKRQEDYFIDKKKERDDKKKIQKAKLQQVTGRQPGSKKDDEENESDEEEASVSGFAKGAVVHVKGIPSATTWGDIRSAVESVWKAGAKEGEDEEVEVAYVDFHPGDEEGWVRLLEAGTASLLVQRARHAATPKGKVKEEEKVEVKKEEEAAKEKEEANDKKEEVKVKEEPVEEEVKEESKEEEEMKVDEAKEEKMKVEEIKEEKMKVEEIKEEKMKVEEIKEEKMKVEEIKEEKMKVEEIKEEKMKVEEIKEEVNGEETKKEEEDVGTMEVCGESVEIRVLRGSEEEAYLEKAQGAREKKFMSGGKGRGGRGRRGGGRRGRGNRGGKRKSSWDSGPASKRGR